MFVYLDESGDSGFKFRHGSSRYFVITLLIVDDPIPIQIAIDDLRTTLRLNPQDEFKFSHSADEIKTRFLSTLNRHDFHVRSLVVDKSLMTQPSIQKRDGFYNYLVRLVLEHDHGAINGATLVLDESIKSKQKQVHLGSYLRQALNSQFAVPKVTKIVHHASHRDNLIQATDMVSGAIYRCFDRGDTTYYRMIRRHVEDLWEWKPRAH